MIPSPQFNAFTQPMLSFSTSTTPNSSPPVPSLAFPDTYEYSTSRSLALVEQLKGSMATMPAGTTQLSATNIQNVQVGGSLLTMSNAYYNFSAPAKNTNQLMYGKRSLASMLLGNQLSSSPITALLLELSQTPMIPFKASPVAPHVGQMVKACSDNNNNNNNIDGNNNNDDNNNNNNNNNKKIKKIKKVKTKKELADRREMKKTHEQGKRKAMCALFDSLAEVVGVKNEIIEEEEAESSSTCTDNNNNNKKRKRKSEPKTTKILEAALKKLKQRSGAVKRVLDDSLDKGNDYANAKTK